MEEKKDIVLDEFNSNNMDDELIDFADDELEDDLDAKDETEQQQSKELDTDSSDFETDSSDFDDLSDFDDDDTTLEEDTEATVEESSINEDKSVEEIKEQEEVETSADESEEIVSTEESTDAEEETDIAETTVDAHDKNSKSSKEETEEPEKPVDLVLYMIIDKPIAGLREYFINYGIKLSRVFSNIAEARDHLLMQVEPTRIIVVDTGSGRFTNMSSRKALVDLLGICDEDTKVSVFYTDNIIKFEVSGAEETEDKQIEWYKYRSTPDMLANLLQHKKKENYIFDSEKSATEVSVTKDCLNITGLPVKVAKEINLGAPAIKLDEIILHLEGDIPEEDRIQEYAIKI